MSTEFKLPQLGESIDSGTIAKVLISSGDSVEEGQIVLELETDKAVLEVPSEVSGKVDSVAASEGQEIKVGDSVFTFSGGSESSAAAEKVKDEGTPDDSEESDETEEEADETPEAPAPTSTSSESSAAQNGVPAQTQQASSQSQKSESQIEIDSGEPIPAAPSVRRLARELGIEIREVTGSGPGGRISENDVKLTAKQAIQSGGGGSSTATGAVPLPDFSKWGETERQPLSKVRNATANQMTRSWQAPHVTQFDKTDITDIEAKRKKYADRAAEHGGKLTVTAILLKAAATALQKFPQFNASLDLAAGEIVQKKYFHIGVAVDTDRGLLVPVIRDVDQKSIYELAAELGGIAKRARDKKISLDEMQGGCFTITNLGGIGGTNFTPIVNAPEVAILGVARGTQEPVYQNGEFVPRLMLPLSLSYDHRVIDGADGARFLRFICEILEDPFLMALES